MLKPLVSTGMKPALSTISCVMLLSLASCAKAEPVELFIPDPGMLNDYTQDLPDRGTSQGFDYQIIQGMAVLQGDILLGPVDDKGQLASEIIKKGVGRADGFGFWPDGIVPYRKPSESMSVQRARVEQAIAHWTENTRMSFVEVTDANEDQYPNHITFQDSQGCASYVGRIGGAQPILISPSCSVGSVIHEIGHAIGLFHEHTRADRNSFVNIDQDEIQSGKENNFAILNNNELDFSSYSPYDYGSIMHYGEYFFSRASLPTIIVPDGVEIGQRIALSDYDVLAANTMYSTDLAVDAINTQQTSQGVEIDMSITNQGLRGAHQIELLAYVGDDSEWLGVSPDSGWECQTIDAELRCSRATLPENTESRFTLLVNPMSASINDLAYVLSSRTMDSEQSNNSENNSNRVWQSQEIESSTDNSQNLDTNGNLPPPLAAASTTDDDDASAGSTGSAFVLILLAGLSLRLKRSRQMA